MSSKNNYTPVPLPELQKTFRENPKSLIGKVPGMFLIDKPQGITSHDVVSMMRKKLRIKRVGHGGTLDPLATGLLIIFAGNATRLFDELQGYSKSYTAVLKLGISTDSYDITGNITDNKPVPEINQDILGKALETFRGKIKQTPPIFSAIKKDGRPLYELAREGIEVEIPARDTEVFSLSGRIISSDEIKLEMEVAKGFYVRSLVNDLGKKLQTCATLTRLRRTAIGIFSVDEAKTP